MRESFSRLLCTIALHARNIITLGLDAYHLFISIKLNRYYISNKSSTSEETRTKTKQQQNGQNDKI